MKTSRPLSARLDLESTRRRRSSLIALTGRSAVKLLGGARRACGLTFDLGIAATPQTRRSTTDAEAITFKR